MPSRARTKKMRAVRATKKGRAAPRPARQVVRGRGGASVISCLRYRHAAAAIEWLCAAFGFEKHLVVPGTGGTIDHAQLRLGTGMIMLGSVARDSEYGRLVQQPDENDGRETQTVYAIVADPDAHYARAKRAGAEILIDIKSEDYGGRGYTCRDPEGHIWTFGSYDPWK
jgi:uncharacterized glyoxalase superfamily protein PhnB